MVGPALGFARKSFVVRESFPGDDTVPREDNDLIVAGVDLVVGLHNADFFLGQRSVGFLQEWPA